MNSRVQFVSGLGIGFLLLVADLALTFPIANLVQERLHTSDFVQNWSTTLDMAPTMVAIVVAAVLIRRYRDTHRSRSWGILTGVIASPILLVVLFVALAITGSIQLGPR